MIWQPHTRRPEPNETALIAVPDTCGPADSKPFLLGEIYRFDEQYGCWMSEISGLKLKHDTFWWMLETELLEFLP